MTTYSRTARTMCHSHRSPATRRADAMALKLAILAVVFTIGAAMLWPVSIAASYQSHPLHGGFGGIALFTLATTGAAVIAAACSILAWRDAA